VRFLHDGEPVDLPAGGSAERPLPAVEASPTPEQPLHRAPPRWPVLGET